MDLPIKCGITIRIPLVLFGFILPALASAQSFEIVDLGVEHPRASQYPDPVYRLSSSGAYAVSNNNVVAGSVEYSQAPPAFQVQNPIVRLDCDDCPATVIDRSWLDNQQDMENGVATGISNNGEYMVGFFGNYYDPRRTGWKNTAGIMMHQGKLEPLPRLLTFIDGEFHRRSRWNTAYDVNDYGEAVGEADGTAVVWRNGDIEVLGSGRAYGINNSGQIVGVREGEGVLWSDNTRYDLGFTPRAINEVGQVVGWSAVQGGSSQALLWDNGMVQNLGTLSGEASSYAYAINDHGEIVGNSKPVIFDGLEKYWRDVARPFLWQCGKMLDLNTLIPGNSGWELIDAIDINNNGRIVGSGFKDGEVRAYMLKPVKGPGRGRDHGRGNNEPPVCPGSQGQGQGRR